MDKVFYRRDVFTLPLLIVLFGLAFGIIGPFGQIDRFVVFERIGLWICYLALGLPLLWAVYLRIKTPAHDERLLKHAILIVVSSAITVGPIFLFVEIIGYTQGRSFPQTLPRLIEGLAEVWIIALILLITCVLCLHVFQKALDTDQTETQIPFTKHKQDHEAWVMPPKLKRMLGWDFGETIHALKAEGNYTRIYRDEGNSLVAIPFNEAMRFLSRCEGAQVHRSWWVNRQSVRSLLKEKSGKVLILKDDIRAPIARRRSTQLKKTGWPI
jgi:hypothetical protein